MLTLGVIRFGILSPLSRAMSTVHETVISTETAFNWTRNRVVKLKSFDVPLLLERSPLALTIRFSGGSLINENDPSDTMEISSVAEQTALNPPIVRDMFTTSSRNTRSPMLAVTVEGLREAWSACTSDVEWRVMD